MKTSDVIAAGYADQPSPAVPGGIAEGTDAGTWQSGSPMGPGTSYTVSAYSPHPSNHELRDAPAATTRRGLLRTLPHRPAPGRAAAPVGGAAVPVTFPVFHTHRQPDVPLANDAVPHGVLAPPSVGRRRHDQPLALRAGLRAGPPARRQGPHALRVRDGVRNWLSQAHGFSYTQTPPRHQFPLESFLFTDKQGYCQQFSGAMALLLRMGGIPARVAAGFTPGTYDKKSGRWIVTDIDAHAWVEAWFPIYGWVRFDPTPTTAPARGGTADRADPQEAAGRRPTGVDARPGAPRGRQRRGRRDGAAPWRPAAERACGGWSRSASR